MTSDAKIGLLLGLVFIFIIAFVINGLPSFHKSTGDNELTTNMIGSQNNPPGLGAKERRAQDLIEQESQSRGQGDVSGTSAAESPGSAEQVRYVTPLPQGAISSQPVIEVVSEQSGIGTASGLTARPQATTEQSRRQPQQVSAPEKAQPKTYIVAAGDTLAVIAKKIYGSEQGNRKINIDRIFKANRNVLSSPDEIYRGQKLVIPPLPGDSGSSQTSKTANALPSSTVMKSDSTDRQNQQEYYVVQEGDSLWSIAAEKLSSGVRYTEIAAANASILHNDDTLEVGMHLRLPAR